MPETTNVIPFPRGGQAKVALARRRLSDGTPKPATILWVCRSKIEADRRWSQMGRPAGILMANPETTPLFGSVFGEIIIDDVYHGADEAKCKRMESWLNTAVRPRLMPGGRWRELK